MNLRIPLAVIWSSAVAVCAYGSGPWDGLWYLDKASSHFAAQTVTLSQLPNGWWRYGDGPAAALFVIDGKPYPEPNAPDFTMTARFIGNDALELVESAYGRDTERDRWALGKDAAFLNITRTRVYPDGHEVTSSSSAVRVAGVSGFAGSWKELAEDSPPSVPPAGANQTQEPDTVTSSRPYWVVSTAADGVMSWFIPATGELIRGKPDGRARPITGPQQPARRTFVWKATSAHRIEFFASDNGHLIARATETLSADGETFTDELWSVGREDEKDVRVFRKR